jgi:hypothetical protein
MRGGLSMARFKLWILVVGIAVAYFSWKGWKLAGVVQAEPQVITCAELARDGYGDNAHVVLTDFYIATAEFVYEERRSGKEWSKVWLPVVSMHSEYVKRLGALPDDAEEIPLAEDFRVILQSEHVEGLDGLRAFGELERLPGVVINEVDSLDSDTKKLLQESFPSVDLDGCWILDHQRKAPGAARGLLFMGFGVLLVAWAVRLFVKSPKKA